MIKGVYFKNEIEYNLIVDILLKNNINIWNIFKDNSKNLISFFYNEDYQNINIGFNILD